MTEKCVRCGRKHRSKLAMYLCQQKREMKVEFEKGLPSWNLNGSREQWLSQPFIRDYGFWSSLAWEVMGRDKFVCQDCKKDFSKRENKWTCHPLEVHHIIPLSTGGTDNPRNLKTLCDKCHRGYTKHLLKNKSAYHKNQIKISDSIGEKEK